MNRVLINTDGGGFPMHQGRVLQDGLDEFHKRDIGCEGRFYRDRYNGGI